MCGALDAPGSALSVREPHMAMTAHTRALLILAAGPGLFLACSWPSNRAHFQIVGRYPLADHEINLIIHDKH